MILSSIRDVVFGYGDEPVIDRLSLDLEAGQFIGITGPNGAAKTTLLKLMLGLLKPWSGTVTLNREITGGGKLTVGYVPQQVASFNAGFPSKVIELVRSGCYSGLGLFRRFTKEQEELVESSLRQVEMWDYRNRRIGELSGGQKQRICIARALAQQPQVLVLDEPVTGMDAASRTGFYELMRHYVSRHGRTVIMVTHGLEETSSYLDTVITLERKEQEGWTCLVTNSCNAHFGQEA
ncbi:metal ABC transporter ATP-binding protein [Paenibacillus sp. FSL M7-0896]|uniref:metal ABC transporter ATP-binding protein n=1 Tax=Paenibacillus sp. FSL M7-0896 TaxID=2921610 RepID=UPI0030DD4E26